jgi:Flp pilus assembly protein TadD
MSVAFAVAGWWLLHPLQTESVTCVIQRTELLVGFFYLLTLYGFIRAAESPAGLGWRILAVGACAAGMGSKEVMVSAPLIVFLYDAVFLSSGFQDAWAKRRGLHLGIAATWIVLGYQLIKMGGSRGTSAGFQVGMSSWSYLLTQCEALVKYLLLSWWPHPLVLDYGNGVVTDLASVAPQALILCALLAATIWGLTRRSPLAFCGACFFAILGPSSSVIPLVTQTIAEHRMDLPLAAIVAPAICFVAAQGGPRVLAALATGALALGIQTAARNATLSEPLRLWTDNVAKYPSNPRGFDNLGLTLVEAGKAEAAIPPYLRALALNPNSVPTNSQLGTAYLASGRYDDAAKYLTRALELDPGFVSARNNLGITLLRSGNPKGAKAQFEFLVAQSPQNIGARWNLGIALASDGDFRGALAQLDQALALDPNHVGVINSSAEILAVAGEMDQAIARFERSLQINPDQPQVRDQIARLRTQAANKPAPAPQR